MAKEMTVDEIIKLLDAGYTKDEISAMVVNQEPQQFPTDQQPEQLPADQQPEPEQPEPANTDSVNAEVSALKDELSNTRQQLAQLVKQMQANNLKTASVNILPESDLEKKTDDAMAELIRPSYERREENNVR